MMKSAEFKNRPQGAGHLPSAKVLSILVTHYSLLSTHYSALSLVNQSKNQKGLAVLFYALGWEL
ncbi:MAG: hypothetical protein V7K55_22435 [Nostoc sp.]|uniref:hypothetical protein n=1 Tax=Nostoc sp. TaxID=1180 RepID=UPI002FF48313